MSSVVNVARRLGELQDSLVVTPREAKRFAGFLILDCSIGAEVPPTTWDKYRFLERIFSGTASLDFSPSRACHSLAVDLTALVTGSYVNLVQARRLAGHLVLSAGEANRQSHEVFRRDRKLCADRGLVHYVADFMAEHRVLERVA